MTETHLTQPIHIHSRVGKDGVLTLRVPLTPTDADTDVLVTIQPLPDNNGSSKAEWKAFIAQTYGSCADLQLTRQEQGVLQERETFE